MEKIKYILLVIFNITVVGIIFYITFIEPAVESIRRIGVVRSVICSVILLAFILYVINIFAGRQD